MVVALNLESARLAVADVDDAGVLARTLNPPGRLGRQPAQMQPRRLVRAVLVPHRRENPEFGETRHPADQLQNTLVLIRLQPVAGDEFGGDLRLVHEALGQRRFLIRDIGWGGKGLLWRKFWLSIALRALYALSRLIHQGWIGFKG